MRGAGAICARNVRRPLLDDVRASAFVLPELVEQLHAPGGAVHHHVLQPLAQQAGKCGCELFGRLDAVCDHAEHGRIAARQQRADARAHTFETAVQIFQRAQAVAFERELVFRNIDGTFAVQLVAAQLVHLLLQRFALLGREALALGQLGHAALQGVLARLEIAELAQQRLALVAEAIAPRAGLADALGHAVDPRFHRGGLGAVRRELLSELLHLRGGLLFFRAQRGEGFVLGLGVRLPCAFVAGELLDARGDVDFLLAQLGDAADDLFELLLVGCESFRQVPEAIT